MDRPDQAQACWPQKTTERFISLPHGHTNPHISMETTRAEGVQTGSPPPPQTHKDIHGHRDRRMCAPTIAHSGGKTSTDEHQETGREPFTDIDVGRLMGTKKHKQNTSCWKH